MLVQKKESPVKTAVLAIILVVAVAIAGFMLYRQFLKPPPPPSPAPERLFIGELLTTFDTKIFELPSYKVLFLHGIFPIVVERVGNKNPFQSSL